MFDFIKTCGQGLLYIILSPILLIIVLINAIYSLGVFLFMFFKRIFMFFSGEDMKNEMKIDKLAKFHIEKQDQEDEAKKAIQPSPIIEKTTTTVVQPIIIQTDQNGVLKSVQIPNSQDENPLLKDSPLPIESKVEEVEEEEELWLMS